MSKLKLGGHRGLGCTDEDFYRRIQGVDLRPTENTLEAIQAGFKAGADFVELDAVMSKDEIMFLLHSVVPQHHFFEKEIPPLPLNQINFGEIVKFNSGRKKLAPVTHLLEALALIRQMAPHTLPWSVCIEIKGVQGSNQPYEDNNFIKIIADTIKKSEFPEERIIWSSFCLKNIIEISNYFPKSSYAMLFSEKDSLQKIYSDVDTDFRYLEIPFEIHFVDKVIETWAKEANDQSLLKYIHPEILTVTSEKMDYIYSLGLSMNSWAYKEKWDDLFINQYKKIISHARKKDYSMNIITDFVEKMKALLSA